MTGYITGFCGTGAHEGTRAKSMSGAARRVCTAIGVCECPCHKKFDELARVTGIERVAYDNPEYMPFESGIREFLESYRSDLDAAILNSRPKIAPEKAFTNDSGLSVESLRVSGREFKPTSRGRGSGQLEDEVRAICNQAMLGEFNEQCTPKLIMKHIQPEPSQGAVAAVLERWSKIGFAVIEHNPLRFVSITPNGLTKGLDVMKDKYKRDNRRSTHRVR